MGILPRLWFRLCAFFRREIKEDDLAEELQFHLEMDIQENIRRGMDPATARREAFKQFGGIEQHKEDCRESWRVRIIVDILRDIRFGARKLWKHKIFSVTIILTLGICIGANSAIFTLLNGLVLRPLPFPEPERLVEIYNSFPKTGIEKESSDIGFYNQYVQKAKSFENLALFNLYDISLENEGTLNRITGSWATSKFFETLKIKPFLGTFFDETHGKAEPNLFAILTHSYWKSNFNADPTVLGKAIQIGRRKYTICGVSPPSLAPIMPEVDVIILRHSNIYDIHYLQRTLMEHDLYDKSLVLFGRLKPGIDPSDAQAEINCINREYYEQFTQTMKDHIELLGHKSQITPLRNFLLHQPRQSLFLIQFSALSLLIIGFITILNLFRAHFRFRESEFITQKKLGANSKDITQQLIIEILLLITVGGLLAICCNFGGLYLAHISRFDILPSASFAQYTRDASLFAFYLLLSIGSLMILLLVVSIRKIATTEHTYRARKFFDRLFRQILNLFSVIQTQVSITLILLILAISLITSLGKIMRTNLGFERENLITFNLNLPNSSYKNNESIVSFIQEIFNSISQISDIDSVSVTSFVPHNDYMPESHRNQSLIGKKGLTHDGLQQLIIWPKVSPGYFNTLKIPILEGRDFNETDSLENSPFSIIIDKTLAERFFPETSPIGQSLWITGNEEEKKGRGNVIGVVQNTTLRHSENEGEKRHIYGSIFQIPSKYFGFLIRSKDAQDNLLVEVKKAIKQVDPLLTVYGWQTLDAVIDKGLHNRKTFTYPFLGFAGLASLLSAVGIFGVLAYKISQRTREIGMRSALGATSTQILALVLREGISKIIIGLITGLIGAYFLNPLISDFLFETSPRDPLIFFIAPLFLFLVALTASYLPARRATKLNPVEALRYE